nr:hypothetical protein [Streptomyces sp. TSRI0281]
MTMTPDPPAPGSTLKAVIRAMSAGKIVDGAYVKVWVKPDMAKPFEKQYDLLKKLRGDTSDWSLTAVPGPGEGPIARGAVELTLTMDLPKETSRGRIDVQVLLFTVDDHCLADLDLMVDFDSRAAS